MNTAGLHWYNVGIDGKLSKGWVIQPTSDDASTQCLRELIKPASRIHALLQGSIIFWDGPNERQVLATQANLQLLKRLDQVASAGHQITVGATYQEAQQRLSLTFSSEEGSHGSLDVSFKRIKR